eukprot:PhF_6_TR24777/c0_g1_i1/m.34030/K05542/DUS1; tRNA-dihydrouridine synthase 1
MKTCRHLWSSLISHVSYDSLSQFLSESVCATSLPHHHHHDGGGGISISYEAATQMVWIGWNQNTCVSIHHHHGHDECPNLATWNQNVLCNPKVIKFTYDCRNTSAEISRRFRLEDDGGMRNVYDVQLHHTALEWKRQGTNRRSSLKYVTSKVFGNDNSSRNHGILDILFLGEQIQKRNDLLPQVFEMTKYYMAKPDADKGCRNHNEVSADVLEQFLGPRYTCPHCNRYGHTAEQCFQNNMSKRMCSVCGSPSHTANRCRKIKKCTVCGSEGHTEEHCFRADPSKLLCTHCGQKGHLANSCFLLNPCSQCGQKHPTKTCRFVAKQSAPIMTSLYSMAPTQPKEEVDSFLKMKEKLLKWEPPHNNDSAQPNNNKIDPFRYYRERLGSPKHIAAPMVDQSELPYRLLLRRHGAQLAFTPMFQSLHFACNDMYRAKEFATCAQDRPLIAQFCGNDPETLVAAAKFIERNVDGFDFNLGCPQGVARKEKFGSYLMEDWDTIFSCIRAMANQLAVPISAKIRLFPDKELNLAYVKMLVDAGASMINIHGRTREMKGATMGLADWNAIRDVVDVYGTTVPILTNGTIAYPGDVAECLKTTNAHGVMVGEALLYDPRFFTNPKHLLVNCGVQPQLPLTEELYDNVYDVVEQYFNILDTTSGFPPYAKLHCFKLLHHLFAHFPQYRNVLRDCAVWEDKWRPNTFISGGVGHVASEVRLDMLCSVVEGILKDVKSDMIAGRGVGGGEDDVLHLPSDVY